MHSVDAIPTMPASTGGDASSCTYNMLNMIIRRCGIRTQRHTRISFVILMLIVVFIIVVVVVDVVVVLFVAVVAVVVVIVVVVAVGVIIIISMPVILSISLAVWLLCVGYSCMDNRRHPLLLNHSCGVRIET
jgi:hypothetical protein